MEVKLLRYTPDAIQLVAEMARSTRQNDFGDIVSQEYVSIMVQQAGYTDEQRTAVANAPTDEDFIRTLIKMKHYGVLEHVVFTFHFSEISRCLTHQLVRHRIASYLQMSNRHVRPEQYNYIIPLTITQYQPALEEFMERLDDAYHAYNRLVDDMHIPVEDARYLLPPAFWTHVSMTMNMRSIRHLLELRMDKHAQWEIRALAFKVFGIVDKIYPVMVEDLRDKYVGRKPKVYRGNTKQ